ncbi:MAG: hypothetical protein IJQ39_02395 [Thermoguttaceae bacterium]|nr:hypothetical protein [Thermoguttaceae bacterium]
MAARATRPALPALCGGSFQKSSEREKAARATGSRASSPAKAKLTCNPSSSSACGGSFQKSSEREKAARATGSRASSPAEAINFQSSDCRKRLLFNPVVCNSLEFSGYSFFLKRAKTPANQQV